MSKKKSQMDARWATDLVFLAALAEQMESREEGDLVRWLRAAIELMIRRAAFERDLGGSSAEIGLFLQDARKIAERQGLGERFVSALEEGASQVSNGQRAVLGPPPLPLVCRHCGGRYLLKY